jgi:hypothetical protein
MYSHFDGRLQQRGQGSFIFHSGCCQHAPGAHVIVVVISEADENQVMCWLMQDVDCVVVPPTEKLGCFPCATVSVIQGVNATGLQVDWPLQGVDACIPAVFKVSEDPPSAMLIKFNGRSHHCAGCSSCQFVVCNYRAVMHHAVRWCGACCPQH